MAIQEPPTSASWTTQLAAQLEAQTGKFESKTLQNDQSQPPTPDGTGKPVNFQVIAPGLYRSSYPQHGHFEHLQDLELKTIVTLVPEPLPLEYANFISTNGIAHHHIPILANKDAKVFTDAATVNKVLELMLEPANFPMLLHCNKGKHRTGCMTACFRKVTGWSTEACIQEYKRYSTPKSRELDQVFITNYDASILKSIALERGYVGGVYGQHTYFTPATSSLSTVASYETATTTTTIASEQPTPKNDYHEKAFKANADQLESTRLWSHK